MSEKINVKCGACGKTHKNLTVYPLKTGKYADGIPQMYKYVGVCPIKGVTVIFTENGE